MMKKTDMLIAAILALFVSLAVVWYAQPAWYVNLSSAINEWREPPRRPGNRYVERDRQRREQERAGLPAGGASREIRISFAVVDAVTHGAVKSFHYRRYFKVPPPEQDGRDMEWTAVTDRPEIHIETARTYTPVNFGNRRETVPQTELWRMAIEDGLRRKRAESDTLEVKADGYETVSVPLFELIHAENPESLGWQEIRLVPSGATDEDVDAAA